MTKEEIIGFLSDMIDALTPKRVGLIALLAAATIFLAMAFENRTSIFNALVGNGIDSIAVPWQLSEESKQELRSLVDKQAVVGAVSITEVNLKKNRRTIKYWYTEDDQFREEVAKVTATMLPQAFFDNDRKNNDQMVAVVGNQFLCTPTADTIFIRFFPGMPKKLPYVCRLSVPPFVGDFAGFVTIGLTRTPTKAEMDSLKIELTRICIELYLRDIDRNSLRSRTIP